MQDAKGRKSSCMSFCAFPLAQLAGMTFQMWHEFSLGYGHMAGLKQEAFQHWRTLLLR